MGATMIARIGAAVVATVARPVAVEIGDFNRIQAGSAEGDVGIDRHVAVAVVVVDDLDAADFDTGTVIGGGAAPNGDRGGNIDEPADANGAIIQVAVDAGIGGTVRPKPVVNGAE